MINARRCVAVLIAAACLSVAACRAEPIDRLTFGFGTDMRAPVLVVDFRINDLEPAYPLPKLSRGGADSAPRTTGGMSVETGPLPEQFEVRALWIEVASGRAYEAKAEIRRDDMASHVRTGHLDILMLPGGELLVGSDPVPTSREVITRDIARSCGTRRPDQDRDLLREPEKTARLPDMLTRFDDRLIAEPCEKEQ
ncbi:hypothetical protein JJJ17_13340 [Paracoccus caeni]|uniref:Lipoprotein n=1 Tax=Paracoccus caeni TaxID=657651 RepID=A0A934VVG1_9RHOB|nr:hypothetical protein [Paracoccus caeni]MBK4216916.1 hypothetical protein [Paracoccus caeni]